MTTALKDNEGHFGDVMHSGVYQNLMTNIPSEETMSLLIDGRKENQSVRLLQP